MPQTDMSNTASTRFSRAFAAAQVIIIARIELGNLWPLAEIFEDKMKGPMTEIKSFIEPIVRNAIRKRELDGIKDEETLIGHLLGVTDGAYLY